MKRKLNRKVERMSGWTVSAWLLTLLCVAGLPRAAREIPAPLPVQGAVPSMPSWGDDLLYPVRRPCRRAACCRQSSAMPLLNALPNPEKGSPGHP